MSECYFETTEGLYHPTPLCRGPWDPNSLSGSVIVALLAFEIERVVASSDYMPARLTVDLYRLPDFSPIEVKTTRVRDGYRIKVIDAEFISGGTSMARASCQMLRKTANSPIEAWSPEPWNVPLPEALPHTGLDRMEGLRSRKLIEGEMGRYGPKKMWIRDDRNLVGDIPLSPWLRAAMVADLTNPWSNSGNGGLGYINSDVSMYLHRLPCDEWLGMEVINHHATDGVAIGNCYLYDRVGAIGITSVASLAQKRSTA